MSKLKPNKKFLIKFEFKHVWACRCFKDICTKDHLRKPLKEKNLFLLVFFRMGRGGHVNMTPPFWRRKKQKQSFSLNGFPKWSFMEISSEHLHAQNIRARELKFWDKDHLLPPVRVAMASLVSNFWFLTFWHFWHF